MRVFPAPLPFSDSLQGVPTGVRAEALQRASPLALTPAPNTGDVCQVGRVWRETQAALCNRGKPALIHTINDRVPGRAIFDDICITT